MNVAHKNDDLEISFFLKDKSNSILGGHGRVFTHFWKEHVCAPNLLKPGKSCLKYIGKERIFFKGKKKFMKYTSHECS